MSELVHVPVQLPEDPVAAVEPAGQSQIDAWTFFRGAIDVLSGLVDANPTDVEGLARTQLLVTKAKRELDLLIEQIRPHLLDCMGTDKQIDLEGIGRLQKRTGISYRQWDHDGLRADVRKEARERCLDADPETGELIAVLTPAESVDAVLHLIWDTFGKVTPTAGGVRKQLGHEPDEYSEVRWGDRTVQITGATK